MTLRTYITASLVAFIGTRLWNARYGVQHAILTKPDLPAAYYNAGNYRTQCTTFDGPEYELFQNCEDAIFWELHDGAGKLSERKAIFACDAGRREWNTVMGPLLKPEPHGTLWLYSPNEKNGKPSRIVLQNYPEGHDFHPLGTEIWPSYGGNASYLYTVNHARDKTVIEQFLLDPATPNSAKWLQTLSSPFFVSPNSIALTSPTSFFVSNDHLFTRRLPIVGKIVPVAETLLAMPFAWVSHVSLGGLRKDGSTEIQHSVVAPFISFPNGVARSPSGDQLAIASTVVGQVFIYNISCAGIHPSLQHTHTIQLPFSVDNVAWDDPSEIIVAGHPYYPELLKFVKDKTLAAPSWVVGIHLEKGVHNTSQPFDTRASLSLSTKVPHPPAPYTVETLFQSDGSVFATSTTGLRDSITGQLIVSGLYAKEGGLVCKPADR